MKRPSNPRSALCAAVAKRGDSLAALSAMIGRNPAYLQQFVARGTPRLLAERDRRLLADYLGLAEGDLGAPDEARVPVRIPRLDVAASAGPGALVDIDAVLGEAVMDAGMAARLGLSPDRVRVIRVSGTSMEPTLLDGDELYVDAGDRSPPTGGAVFVVRIDGAVMVKRVARAGARLRVTSDNPDADPVPPSRVEVIGRVVWQTRRLR